MTPDCYPEFFMDYVLRKVVTKPHEYIRFMPAVKYFYRYLLEIGYKVKKFDETMKLLDVTEVHFLEKIRKRFG
jgi:predicted metal-dependent HD superfamily phosphohydrolase